MHHVDPTVLNAIFAAFVLSSSPRRLRRAKECLLTRKEALERTGDPRTVERAIALLTEAEAHRRVGR